MNPFELSIELARRYMPTIINQFGCLALRDAYGKVTASGSAIFLDLEGVKLIVTADHVASQLIAGEGEISLFVLPPADVLLASPLPFSTSGFRIHRDDYIEMPQAAILDFAVFRVSKEIASVQHLRWIESSGQLRAIKFLRSECQREKEPFLLLITGFPNFARLTDTEHKVQLFSNFQCWGYLQQIIEAPAILFGASCSSPQMIFEIEIPSEDDIPNHAQDILRRFVRGVHDRATNNEPLGGYSGAPVFYLTSEAYYLIGIIKEGRNDFAGRTFATTIDDMVGIIQRNILPEKMAFF